MSIKRISDLPEGSGNLTNDDIFVFMDDPAGSGVTKKISLSAISGAIGGGGGGGGSSDPKVIYYSGVFPSTIHNLDHQDADMIVFDLKDNTNIPNSSGYLSLTGMKAGKDGQRVILTNITDYTVSSSSDLTAKKIYIFNSVLGSGSLSDNRFDFRSFIADNRANNIGVHKGMILSTVAGSDTVECVYHSVFSKWIIYQYPTEVSAAILRINSPGSVGGGGV